MSKKSAQKKALRKGIDSPSQYYRSLRPEKFSDTTIEEIPDYTRELVAFQLAEISKDQKEHDFETLCRRLCEKHVAPNLIPQVGPSGGGDGKIDSETYPVAEELSERWFLYSKEEDSKSRWAFAFSAKKDWSSKFRSDVMKIVGTKRGYHKVFFVTNQAVPSRRRKDREDTLSEEFGVECILLDREWILAKAFDGDSLGIIVDSLNLSSRYHTKVITPGKLDQMREGELKKLEEAIANPNRYFEYDYQLVEDSLIAAITSRELERPRAETEGRFARALRFAVRTNHPRQVVRVRYQICWTFANYLDDADSFVSEFQEFQKLISVESPLGDLEYYMNLVNLLRGMTLSGFGNPGDRRISLEVESGKLRELFNQVAEDTSRPVRALSIKTYLSILDIMFDHADDTEVQAATQRIIEYVKEGASMLQFPFEYVRDVVDMIGSTFIESKGFDQLVEVVAEIEEKRSSRISSGEIFIRRGGQKLEAKKYYDAVRYLGKAVMKLATSETEDGMSLACHGLSHAYSEIGLHWAAQSCNLCAATIEMKSLFADGVITGKMVDLVHAIVMDELMLGRIPALLVWIEFLSLAIRQVDDGGKAQELMSRIDGCLAIRLLTAPMVRNVDTMLPGILARLELGFSREAMLYKLGYIEELESGSVFAKAVDEDIEKAFQKLVDQPFRRQIYYPTLYQEMDRSEFRSKILGANIYLEFPTNVEFCLFAESFLSLLESFFAVTFRNVMPAASDIKIVIDEIDDVGASSSQITLPLHIEETDSAILLNIGTREFLEANSVQRWELFAHLLAQLLGRYFMVDDPQRFLTEAFEKDEIHERLTISMNHPEFIQSALGDLSSLSFRGYLKSRGEFKGYDLKREEEISFAKRDDISDPKNDLHDLDDIQVSHGTISHVGIINLRLWDAAGWNAFGFEYSPRGLYVFLVFSDIIAGEAIFEEWKQKFGECDKGNKIRVSIITETNDSDPFQYIVHLTSNLPNRGNGQLIVTQSRFLPMRPNSSENLNHIEKLFGKFRKFYLCPAQLNEAENRLILNHEKAIEKDELIIKKAKDIGENEIDSIVLSRREEFNRPS